MEKGIGTIEKIIISVAILLSEAVVFPVIYVSILCIDQAKETFCKVKETRRCQGDGERTPARGPDNGCFRSHLERVQGKDT